ncbi:MAG: hypothetical protein Dasosvirus8_10 [Dasosvirus sp.]|uniref:Uncharacterized protein n=1 Tax=Dasosvirus sp. TaxID=2487764 RepID=A0A3G4ZRN5_9VIRU|nr:MAG: hypothetical protein Dasosvirus8_10 [Dasosvirus sp.]
MPRKKVEKPKKAKQTKKKTDDASVEQNIPDEVVHEQVVPEKIVDNVKDEQTVIPEKEVKQEAVQEAEPEKKVISEEKVIAGKDQKYETDSKGEMINCIRMLNFFNNKLDDQKDAMYLLHTENNRLNNMLEDSIYLNVTITTLILCIVGYHLFYTMIRNNNGISSPVSTYFIYIVLACIYIAIKVYNIAR